MTHTRLIGLGLAGLMLVGCSDDDDDNGDDVIAPVIQEYQLTLTNLTANQPMSPLTAYLHDGNLSGWTIGQSASNGLEQLAEGGDGTDWLAMAEADGASASGSGDIPLGPGESQVVVLMLEVGQPMQLTAATMLVNTNDAFAGINGWNISGLEIGGTMTTNLPLYDAGTEANSELAATIPGPAGGGAGYDTTRDDVDFVARHGGVVTADDGATDSALDSSHRFDGPVGRLMVKRLQ